MSNVHVEHPRLERVDLNLLVALELVLRLRSVTAAAKQLGVTQSAMSHNLRRLREQFADPLLVRGRAGMLPTPRAEALEGPLRAALLSLSRSIAEGEGFEPENARRCFRIASPDLFDALVLPRLLARLKQAAPLLSITVEPGATVELPRRLDSGVLDLAIVATLLEGQAEPLAAELGAELRTRRLFRDRFQAFVRQGHPAIGARRLSARAFAKLDHVLVSPTGRGQGVVDAVLAKRGLERRIVVRSPHFATAIAIAAESDLVLVAPGGLSRRATFYGLCELPLAIELPEHAVNMVWHGRMDADPGHVWFRGQLAESASTVTDGPI